MPPDPQTDENMMTVTIDGVEHRIPKERGLTIMQLCDRLGNEIPRFCYHPRLTIPANCRMCLVEVEKAPKLMPACHTELRDGSVVNTQNARVRDAREAILEFLLVNHPVDCPICDQAGECPLQDQYFQHDRQASRVGDPVRKVKKGKAVELGPRVTLDQERCVLCTRCVRFMAEVAHEPQLGMHWRNDHSYIDVFPGEPLTSNYSLNTVQICPVGALTSSDFRFQKRVWELERTAAVCEGCDRGCNAWIDQDGRKVFRYRARDNDHVNQSWMCDHGFLSYGFMNEDRVTTVRFGRGAAPNVGASLVAAQVVAQKLEPIVGHPEGLGVLVSARVSTEDALMAAWFTKEVLGSNTLHLGGREEGEADAILLRADRNPNRLGVELAAKAFGLQLKPFGALFEDIDSGRVKMVYAVGADVPMDDELAAATFEQLEYFVLQSVNGGPLARVADMVLPAASPAEYDGTFVNFMGRVQRFFQAFEPRGEAATHWDWLGEVARKLGHPVDHHDSGDVWAAHAPRSDVLGAVKWDDIGHAGVQLEGVGSPDDQTGGKGMLDDVGVSRWPR